MRRAAVGLGMLLAVIAARGEEMDAPGEIDVAARLAAVADESTMAITTRGRVTGRPHTKPVWFVVDGSRIWLGTLNPERDWVRNVKKDPQVTIAIGDVRYHGRLTLVTDAALARTIAERLARKYWAAWFGSWFGAGPRETYQIDELREPPDA